MSKSQQRSRDAGKKPPPTNTPAAVTHEIIPGKFTEHDWIVLLERDDSDEFVTDIVESICNNTLDIIFKNYIQKQLIPYTVCQVKDAIVQIIEWQFLGREEEADDFSSDPAWQEDEEPVPAVVDCWAQGSVPRISTTPRYNLINEVMDTIKYPIPEGQEEADLSNDQNIDQLNLSDTRELITDDTPILGANEIITNIASENNNASGIQNVQETDQHIPETKTPKKKDDINNFVQMASSNKKHKFKKYVGRLPAVPSFDSSDSLDKTEMRLLAAAESSASDGQNVEPNNMQMPLSCQSLLKLQAGRPPGNREVVYDEHGNVVSVVKVDVDKLSAYTVKTIFKVVDLDTEAAQARLEAMRTGKYRKSNTDTKTVRTTGQPTTKKFGRSKANMAELQSAPATRERIMTLPPPLLESMNLAPGVVMREGERVKEGPKLEVPSSARLVSVLPLQPVRIRPDSPLFKISENKSPIIRPLGETIPIPPIKQQPLMSQ